MTPLQGMRQQMKPTSSAWGLVAQVLRAAPGRIPGSATAPDSAPCQTQLLRAMCAAGAGGHRHQGAGYTKGTRTPLGTSLGAAAALAAGAATAGAWYIFSDSSSQPASTHTPARTAGQQGTPHKDPLLEAITRTPADAEASTADSQHSEMQSVDGSVAVGNAPAAVRSSSTAAVPGPWVTDDELAVAMQRRALAENRLRGYLHVKQREVQTWLDRVQMMRQMSQEEFEREMLRIEEEVNLQTNVIMYGINDPNARKVYLTKYGCSKWSEQALKAICAHSPLIEIGAGLGHWQAQLAARGANVLAYDNMSNLPLPDVRMQKPEFAGKVEKGDEAMLAKHPKRTLLLVYPGPDDMAVKTLRKYNGNTLLYVGESLGGVNANEQFFKELEKDWECTGTVPVEPFAEGYEKLWVLRRKKSQSRGWLW